jgi:hypothetical protein
MLLIGAEVNSEIEAAAAEQRVANLSPESDDRGQNPLVEAPAAVD